MQKLLIRNAQIATSERVFSGDLLAENGKITQIGDSLSADHAEVIDATGKYLLPGAVDVHTHFDLDVGIARASDDFHTGTIAAAFGGTTTVVDHMGFGPEGCSLLHQVGVYHKLAAGAVIDYSFHGVIQHVNDEVLADMQRMRDEEGITSLKLYLTYGYKLDDEQVLRVFRRAKELALTICIHCENDAVVTMLRSQFVREGKTQVKYHPLSRPAQAEAEAVFRMLMLAKVAGCPNVYIVHLSTGLGLEAIRIARKDGQPNIYAETCPQYLFLDDSRYDDPVEGLKFTISPPLRTKKDNAALWHGIENGDIDTIATDHCPFFFATQKQMGAEDFTKCPGGAPGVELRFPLLLSEGFMKKRLTLPQVVSLCCTRPAQLFGLAPKKGDIAIGADADLVLFDPDLDWTVTKARLHENVDYTPYEGFALQGSIITTISRGDVIVDDGQFFGRNDRGRYIKRKIGMP